MPRSHGPGYPRRKAKKTITQATKQLVALRLGALPGTTIPARCWYCDATGTVHWDRHAGVRVDGLTFDHIHHEYKGGAHTADNLILACRSCNSARGPLTAAAFWRRRRAAR